MKRSDFNNKIINRIDFTEEEKGTKQVTPEIVL